MGLLLASTKIPAKLIDQNLLQQASNEVRKITIKRKHCSINTYCYLKLTRFEEIYPNEFN